MHLVTTHKMDVNLEENLEIFCFFRRPRNDSSADDTDDESSSNQPHCHITIKSTREVSNEDIFF